MEIITGSSTTAGRCSQLNIIQLLVVLLLGFYRLISFNDAAPLLSTAGSSRRMLQEQEQKQEPHYHLVRADIDAYQYLQVDSQELWKHEEMINKIGHRLMEIETNDYPGSGANGRHTPTPGKG